MFIRAGAFIKIYMVIEFGLCFQVPTVIGRVLQTPQNVLLALVDPTAMLRVCLHQPMSATLAITVSLV